MKEKLFNIIHYVALHWSSYVFAVGSLGYGLILLFKPSLFASNEAYGVLNTGFRFIGIKGFAFLFIGFGLLKIIATSVSHRKLRMISLHSLLFLWLIICLSFFTQWIVYKSDNAGWWLTLIIILNGLNVLIAGSVDKWYPKRS